MDERDELIDELYHKSRSALEETATLRAEIARLRKAIVWVVKAGVRINQNGLAWRKGHAGGWEQHDGTDESLIATVCRLAGEE